ncbi:hypothetical protein BJ973_002417 [Actinoplanes tereljensis]|uniref:SMODS and SLOG-associating 2TM effector domain-containing protein n=1 Tax=Paractinoplanes tereljensis TaxID=571912 RepID=A0A919NQ92_9ACTN|nr:SLATT domain-containing protein [Actinoplanes tereljensis]GIF22091.1 hypothetical protein Ate02nite_48210 [Actinoplanes tereljensis]
MTSSADALSYVEERIRQLIGQFSESKRFFRRGSLIQTSLTASLAALTTFLIGVNQIYTSRWLAMASLAAAGVATVAAAWTGWFGYRQAWIGNQATLNRLYALRDRIGYDKAGLAGQISQEMVEAYRAQYQEILNHANSAWEQMRSQQN